MLRDLAKFTPDLLSSFVNIPEGQYPLLRGIGESFLELQRTKEESDRADELLRRAQEIAGILKS